MVSGTFNDLASRDCHWQNMNLYVEVEFDSCLKYMVKKKGRQRKYEENMRWSLKLNMLE